MAGGIVEDRKEAMSDYFYKKGYKLKLKKQHRLLGYDYSSPGWYFITICTKNKDCFLGEINKEQMVLSKVGLIARMFWLEIPKRFSNISLDEWVIMPNHLHGILAIIGEDWDFNIDREADEGIGREAREASREASGNAPWRVPTLLTFSTLSIIHTNPNPTTIKNSFETAKENKEVIQSDRVDILTGIHPLKKNSISSVINHFKGNVKRYCNKNGMEYFEWQSLFHDRIIRNEKALLTIRRYIRENPKRWVRDRFIPKID